MNRRRQMLVVLVAGAALGSSRPRWTGDREDRVVAVCWLAGVTLWSWLAVVSAVHAWATRTGRARWRRVSGALLPAAVRRRVEQLAVAGMLVVPVAACSAGGEDRAAPVLVLEETVPLEAATSVLVEGTTTTVATPPSAAPPSAPPSSAPPGSAPPGTTAPTTTAPATAVEPPAPAPAPTDPAPGPVAAPDPDAADPVEDPDYVVPVDAGTRVVLRGDNLWSIAAEQLQAATGRAPTPDETREYWAALVGENRATLASGDPDVIYPGEVVRLPALRS